MIQVAGWYRPVAAVAKLAACPRPGSRALPRNPSIAERLADLRGRDLYRRRRVVEGPQGRMLGSNAILVSTNAGPSQLAGKDCSPYFFSTSWQ
ncbi:MAG: hypothetical protein HUU35_12890, partial [Armatimonadetes bacterium]|nr:hypothetical protein [Armatimonadota bacterium]